MKKTFTIFSKLTMVCMFALALFSCSKNEDSAIDINKVTITDVTPSFSSVKFTLEVKEANVVAYAVLEATGTPITATQVVDKGKHVTSLKGTYEIEKLNPNTKYIIAAVAITGAGTSEVSQVEFSTLEDTGIPATEYSAGIRVVETAQNDVKLTVITGEKVQFAFVAVWPKIYMQNLYYEARKINPQMTEMDYYKSFMKDFVAYSFRVGAENGPGSENTFTWMATSGSFLMPSADYLVLTCGMKGEDDYGDVMVSEFKTKTPDRQGNPDVELKLKNAGFISALFEYIPNEDCYYYFRFASDKDQIDEFVKEFGEEGLRQFLRFIDIQWENQTEQKEESIAFDLNVDPNHNFTMLALGMDRQLMVGDKYKRVDFKLTPKPADKPQAKFEMKATATSATTAMLHFDMEESCGRIYLNVIPASRKGEIEAANQDQLKRELWEEGWVIARTGSNPTDPIATPDWLWMDLSGDQEYILVATGLNYYGGLSDIKFSEPFKTKPLTYTGSSSDIKLSLEKVTKTSAQIKYDNDQTSVVLYHRLVQYSADFDNQSNDAIRSFLLKDGNIWKSNDVVDGRVFSYTWTSMDPGTEYVYYWCGEDQNGRISDVRQIRFKTAVNVGGPNPKVSFKMGKIEYNKAYVEIIPNNDCTSLLALNIESNDEIKAIEASTTLTEEQKTKKLIEIFEPVLTTQGIATIEGFFGEMEGLKPKTTYYVTAMPFGAENVEGSISFIKYTTPVKGEVINPSSIQLIKARTGVVKATPAAKGPKGIKALKDQNVALSKQLARKSGVPSFTSYKEEASSVDMSKVSGVRFLDFKNPLGMKKSK